ncbi:Glycerate dehydrogenase [Lacunisphaera limnophila]|uniref:Glycerate dehydrogenase n=1 Tax=Lacunisphaera limnophila TaxID=1838286 RepID=A0A1D8AV48_9BACT|nr:hydroxyacid dehydrogenase [Lacunisphaera limnophila]AOS44770.1 Glycerate dehydrogenase [Lacunisphaera limnophila]
MPHPLTPPLRPRPSAVLALRPELQPWLFPPSAQAQLEHMVALFGPISPAGASPPPVEALQQVEVLVGSWGIPVLDRGWLDAMPNLRVVLYAAGTVRGFVTDEFWRRGIQLSTAATANAGPTAIFAEAMILLALKHTWFYLREKITVWPQLADTASSGVHASTVGIIGLSRVGRHVIKALQRHELNILLYDPTVTAQEADHVGVTLCDLRTLFATSDVVSLHAPLLPQTTGMIGGKHLRVMKPHATFVNTARGALVNEAEMIAILQARPDLTAVLDVTETEPTPADSPLRRLPNVVLTPHLAGARHRELALLGRVVLEELSRYLAGQPLAWAVDQAAAARMA